MRINRIELYNIGSYEDHNEFDIRSQSMPGNIIVVGGKNGAGKTTLFTSIKLCLYGYKKSGYQAMSAFYKREIKKLINDKAKAENNANAYVLLDLDILNGQEWDRYVLKREWSVDSGNFEVFSVFKNGEELDEEQKIDFDNYLMNLLPPELFELYFFDGEKIADFFLEDKNNERIKNAFLTICGYDTFDIIYRNFQRVSKQQDNGSDPTLAYFEIEEQLHQAEVELKRIENEIQSVTEEIEIEDTKLRSLEEGFRSSGGVSLEEWNQKLLDLKNEERIREEKNAWVKNAVNELIPYIILNRELIALQTQMEEEKELERRDLLKDSLFSLMPEVFANISPKYPEFSNDLQTEIMEELLSKTGSAGKDSFLNLSKNEYSRLQNSIIGYLGIDKSKIIEARGEIKESIARSQEIRDQLDRSNMDGVDSYLEDKQKSVERKRFLVDQREELLHKHLEAKARVEKTSDSYTKAEKELEKHFKTQSITALTAKAILFLEKLQKQLYDAEISKVKTLFMEKMHQLMRKEQFIDRIEIDEEFNVHVFKSVPLDIAGIKRKIRSSGEEAYELEYGKIHCMDLLEKSGCASLRDLARGVSHRDDTINVLIEFDKTTMSKGEKQVFIMALYWSIMQLSKKDIPFIIDTPFARIDTEHREHITERFFKELQGQVFIFSTDEEITDRHMSVIGEKLGGKFLIENVNNTRTSITSGRYFGE